MVDVWRMDCNRGRPGWLEARWDGGRVETVAQVRWSGHLGEEGGSGDAERLEVCCKSRTDTEVPSDWMGTEVGVIGIGNCGGDVPFPAEGPCWGTHRDAEMPLGKPNGELKRQLDHSDTRV